MSLALVGNLAQAQLTVQEGLVLWLQADAGVTADGSGGVSMWEDQSPHGNHAYGVVAEEFPRRIDGVVNGQPVIRFDGVDDVLELDNAPTLQPMNGDWTVIFVAQRGSASQGDFPQIIGSRPWVAGMDKGWAVSFSNPGGRLGSHFADGVQGHDVPQVLSTTALSQEAFQLWQVEEDRAAGFTRFFLSGAPDRYLQTAMPSGPLDQQELIYLGREMGGANNRRANLDLAEVLVYKRVLPKTDRDAVSGYLSTKYGLDFTPNAPPSVSLTGPSGGASFAVPADLVLTAAAADSDGTVARVEFYQGTRLIATATAEPYSVPVRIESTGSVTFTVLATDNLGDQTTSAPVTITLTGTPPATPPLPSAGLQLWLSADTGVTADSAGSVSAWVDRSPNAHLAAQDNSAANPPDNWQPTLVANVLGGKPVVRFDGLDDFLRIPNHPSLQPLGGDWTVLLLAQRGATSRGDFPQIIGSRPWAAGQDKGWAVCFRNSDGLIGSQFADGSAGHDVGAALSAAALSRDTFQVWQVEENRTAGSTAFYLFGELNRQLQPPMPAAMVDQLNDIFIGSEVEGSDSRRANLDLAELVVYNRVLSEAERNEATTHLLRKYGIIQLAVRNQAPTVRLDSPAPNSVLDAPATITLQATAEDADGNIVRVEFFLGNRLLGVADQSPFQLQTTLTALGAANLSAVATDNFGAQTVSDPVPIRVVALDVTLIGKVDYSDTFTLGGARTDGLFNDNANGAYRLENNHGNPAAAWTPASAFSFNTPASSTDPAKVGAAAGNSGAVTGLAQSGGGDSSFTYGLQPSYVVQLTAILPTDRLDITSLPTAGGGIFAPNSLSVFLRRDSASTLPGIGLFNGSQETGVTHATGAFVRTGVNDDDWHNFAVHFDQPNRLLRVYVDGVLITTVNLVTFADGLTRASLTASGRTTSCSSMRSCRSTGWTSPASTYPAAASSERTNSASSSGATRLRASLTRRSRIPGCPR